MCVELCQRGEPEQARTASLQVQGIIQGLSIWFWETLAIKPPVYYYNIIIIVTIIENVAKTCKIESKYMQNTTLMVTWWDTFLNEMLRNFQYNCLLWILQLEISIRSLGSSPGFTCLMMATNGHSSSTGRLWGRKGVSLFQLTRKMLVVLRFLLMSIIISSKPLRLLLNPCRVSLDKRFSTTFTFYCSYLANK